MARDPQTAAHLEWIGFVQPVGLVVSIPALLNAQAYINKNIGPVHQRFLASLEENSKGEPVAKIADFRRFVCDVLEWQPSDLIEVTDANCDKLEVPLPEYQERLRPTYVVPELRPKEGHSPWQMIVQVINDSLEFDEGVAESKHGWHASPQAKFERLLRETEIPVGLLANSRQIRLVYAPRGESSGHITFSVADMMAVAGRPILAALYLLLSVDRLFLLQQESQRLPGILSDSRKYQNTVSNALAEQVLEALFELVRGFQSADEQLHGNLLRSLLKENPNEIYGGLLTVLMRLVFILYAEDRGLLSSSAVYVQYYSISRLFEKLREDAGQFPDTMDHRYGAWAQLLTLFRLIYDGGSHADLQIPARKGHLFDPNNYPFLEGRLVADGEILGIPQVSDGVMFRVLRNLLMLHGERLSYRTLDVEQIGSVYEAIMGFSMQIAEGTSIAIKAKKTRGAPTTIDLDKLLTMKPADRVKKFLELTDQELAGAPAQALKEANIIPDLLAALEKKVAKNVTPFAVPKGTMVLQPSNQRRKSGSHYTPRALTEPIVRKALQPILNSLGAKPTPEQILEIKVCDPAMGSGAFLVEACRQLGDELVRAWSMYAQTPDIPADEDELLHARRIIAQRCLYGIDKNPMAVNLAKLSLWLATLAKDHPFTFLDHTFRCGDSLVGLDRDQILRFHWDKRAQRVINEAQIKKCVKDATNYRKEILEKAENTLYAILRIKLSDADKALQQARTIGDLVVEAHFSADKERARAGKRDESLAEIASSFGTNAEGDQPEKSIVILSNNESVRPFHWEIEFPEVFDRDNGGFDCVIGNPPFMGGSKLSSNMGKPYMAWLSAVYEESKGKSDLVAYFFRLAFKLIRRNGTFGLIATNSIAQGDTRFTALRYIRNHGGIIYCAERRRKWPGMAAVVVSTVHVRNGTYDSACQLDGRETNKITAYLIHFGPDENPHCLVANRELVHSGTNINGKGFVLSPSEREDLLSKSANYDKYIRPYLGAVEMNDSPTSEHSRYVTYLEGLSEEQVQQLPDLYDRLYRSVRVQRQGSSEKRLREQWWTYSRPAKSLYAAAAGKNNILASGRAGGHICFVFQPVTTIFSDSLTLFIFDSFSGFAVLQSRVHEVWARLMGSSLKDDVRYIPEDCFDTFAFPVGFVESDKLKQIGKVSWSPKFRPLAK